MYKAPFDLKTLNPTHRGAAMNAIKVMSCIYNSVDGILMAQYDPTEKSDVEKRLEHWVFEAVLATQVVPAQWRPLIANALYWYRNYCIMTAELPDPDRAESLVYVATAIDPTVCSGTTDVWFIERFTEADYTADEACLHMAKMLASRIEMDASVTISIGSVTCKLNCDDSLMLFLKSALKEWIAFEGAMQSISSVAGLTAIDEIVGSNGQEVQSDGNLL